MIRHVVLVIIAILAVSGCSRSIQAPTTTNVAPPAPEAARDKARDTDGPAQTHEILADNPPEDAAGKDAQNGERPKLKSRWARTLTEQLDKAEGGSDADRNLIRDTLQKNDEALDRAFTDLTGRIRAANNTHDGPRRIAIPAP